MQDNRNLLNGYAVDFYTPDHSDETRTAALGVAGWRDGALPRHVQDWTLGIDGWENAYGCH